MRRVFIQLATQFLAAILLVNLAGHGELDAGEIVSLAPVSNLASVRKAEFTGEFGTMFAQCDQLIDQAATECDAICQDIRPNQASCEDRQWHLLPDGLLWKSYLAGPHEPRIALVTFNDTDGGIFWDATVGGRVGLIRYGTAAAKRPQGWQWDLEGAVITRLDLLHAQDVESTDYRFGTVITAAEGPWAMKFGYFHISSHVGDEYLIRNSIFERINYVTESLVGGVSYSPSDALRFYGEMANAFRASGGAKRYQFQTGAEYTPVAARSWNGAPFAAVNLNFREAVDYDVSITVQMGWGFQSPRSGRRIRFGIQYSDGPTSQYSFFERREEYLGMGVWFDY